MCVVLVHFCNIIFTNTHSIGKAEGERAKSGEVLGFINPRGDWEIKTLFQFCENFDAESGLARVKIKGHWAHKEVGRGCLHQ